jgi:hypothetical protein
LRKEECRNPSLSRTANNIPVLTGKSWIGWVERKFEQGILFIDVQFVDKTALSWSIGSAIVIKEAHLADWKTGDLKLLKRFVQNKSDVK